MAERYTYGVRVTGDSKDAVRAIRLTNRELDSLQREVKETHRSTSKLERGFQGWAAGLGKVRAAIGPLAGAAGVGMLQQLTTNALAQTAALSEQADVAGVTAERYQELTKAFSDLGGVAEGVTGGALRRFNRRLGLAAEGAGAAQDTFGELGISIRDASGNLRDSQTVLNQTLRRLAAIDSESRRAAQASEVFGEDAGPRLAAVLGQGTAAIEENIDKLHEQGRVMSDEVVADARELNDQYNEIADTLQTKFRTAVVAATGELKDFVGWMDQDIQGSPLMAGMRELQSLMESVSPFVGDPNSAAQQQSRLDSMRPAIERARETYEQNRGVFGEDSPATQNALDHLRQLEATYKRIKGEAQATERATANWVNDSLVRSGVPGRLSLPAPGGGSGGGSGGTSGGKLPKGTVPDRLDATHVNLVEEHRNELLEDRKRILSELQTPQERYNEQIKTLNELRDTTNVHTGKAMLSEQQYARAVADAKEELQQATGAGRELQDVARDLNFTFQSAFEDAIIQGQSLRDVVQGLAQDLQRIILRQSVTGPLGDALAGGVSNIVSGAFSGGTQPSSGGNAHANAILANSADGNVFSGPSITSVAEQGQPEAVFPLTRMGGQLGIQAAGGGTDIQIIDQRGQGAPPIETERRRGSDGREQVRMFIRSEVREGFNDGGFDHELGGNFGVRRQGSR